jgi:hypothetical protein
MKTSTRFYEKDKESSTKEKYKGKSKKELNHKELEENEKMGYQKNRIQVYNPKIGRWVKIDTETGRVLSVKSDKKPYKGIRKR